jgi:hypothetical protein
MTRYTTVVEDGTVYVGTDTDRLEIAPLDDVLEAVGGPAWTISYSDAEKRQRPEMDTDDEGLTVDVVDMLQAMTHSERFVETLAAYPAETDGEQSLSPRAGMFVGKLLENLENGVD